jgi:hypothetical protein
MKLHYALPCHNGQGLSVLPRYGGNKGLTTTTITTTTTFNTKHNINYKLPQDYASSMLSQFYKLSLLMLYMTFQ